jgi:signal transduction histidine kinase
MATSDSTVSAARWLLGVTAGVVLAFVVATAISQRVQRAITVRTSDIITNAMPSVKLLSAARGELNEMDRDVERATYTESQRTIFEQRASSARHDLEETATTYMALPFFPHEQKLFSHTSDALGVLDTDYATWKARPTEATLTTLRADIESVDAALERGITFDAEQGQRLGLEIAGIRESSTGLVIVLEGLAALLAAGAVVLAVRQLRRAAHAHRLEDAAREQRETELRAANEALGEFAGRVAHDVLSPLMTTMLALDLVRHTCEIDEVAMRVMDNGANALHSVRALVDGLLAFSRAGGKPEVGANTELAPVLRNLCDGLTIQAQHRNITIALESVPTGAVACSAGVFTSIVTNLLQNAMKYMGDAPERRITTRVEDAGTSWHIAVTDTGMGIPDDQLRRIFEPYVQVATNGNATGIGLGLATVDRLVRAHGGNVGVQSTLSAGSTFWFELPKSQRVPALAAA